MSAPYALATSGLEREEILQVASRSDGDGGSVKDEVDDANDLSGLLSHQRMHRLSHIEKARPSSARGFLG
jgi:hypothetical protein